MHDAQLVRRAEPIGDLASEIERAVHGERRFACEDPRERLTRAGFFVGTLMYVAPEALSGELVSPAADQYSLATIAYLMLTGCLPFTAKTPREMFSQLLSQPPVPLNDARAGLSFSSAVEQVVMRGLSKDPRQRYSDTCAFAEALRDALANTAVPAAPGLLDRMKSIFKR